MSVKKFSLREGFIPLSSLLKATGLASTGGHAKVMILSGEVSVNDEIESRIRRKCLAGDIISVEGASVEIVPLEK
jgi:ribosome-associated protein